MNLSERIREKAVELGCDLVGIAPAGPARHGKAFQDWIASGYNADMSWMAREPERRIDTGKILPGARSVVATGFSYFVQDPPAGLWEDPSRGRVSRYAWGQDYHEILKPRLEELALFIRGESDCEVHARTYVDTGPILENDVAWQAGLGFQGKNSLLISPTRGSYMFLGEIVVDIELDYDAPLPNEGATACGNCRRCLEACPTQAFPAPFVLDSRRCISYLTIEHRGSIPEELRPLMKNWIFGCDECQSICPWVKRHAEPAEHFFLAFEPEWAAPSLLTLIGLDEVDFRKRFVGSPIMRAHRSGLLRNVAVALGNWGSPEAIPALKKALEDPDQLIGEHAAWALAQIALREG